MARIRSIKPEFWDDRKLAKRTSRDARLLYVALWNLADEHARLNGDPQWIKCQVFPYEDDLDANAVAKMLEELAATEVGAVAPYEVDGDPYLFLPKLAKHQRLEPHKVESRLPAAPAHILAAQPAYEPDESEPPADESPSDPDQSARRADQSARRANRPALSYVAGSREHVAGSRSTRGAATMLGNSLLDEHLAQVTPRPPRDVVAQLGERIDRLLSEGMADDEVQEALRRLRAKPRCGPGLLPSLVDEVRRERANPASARQGRWQSTTDERVAQAQALKAEFRSEAPDSPVPPANVVAGRVVR